MIEFFSLGVGIYTQRWTIINTVIAISDFLVSLAPIVICFCEILGFLWIDIANIISLPSLFITLDSAWNVLIRILQIPINSIINFSLPSITNVVIEFNVGIVSLGDWVEETIFLLLETFFQIISVFLTIPDQVLQLFNARYMRVISEPLACIATLLNMTLEASTHLTDIQAPDRSGIAFFQFGQIIDRLKIASAGFSELFVVIGSQEQCFVRELINTIITILAVFLEMIPGALFFVFLPSCCQNPLDFFVDYWFTPGNSLVQLFSQIELVTGCVRQILSQLNAPFACSIQHLLNVIVEFLKIVTQMLIFSLDIITFQPFPTLLDINLDPMFTEFLLWCQCTADIIRQFDSNFCVPIPGDDKQNLICCFGALLVTICNLIENLLLQLIDFVFDIITLPTGTIILANVRIPNFNDAIMFLNISMCELACSATSVIPLNLGCVFSNPNITCDRPTGCAATLICRVTSGLLIPLILFNDFLIKLRTSGFFSSLFVWVEEPTALITQWIADVIDFLGAFLDCIICAALDNGVNCTDDTYQVTHSVAVLLPTIRPFFTSVAMIIVKIVLALIKGLFVDHQPIGAIIEAVFQFIAQVMGTLGPALVKFFVDLLNRLGLDFLGTIINALWLGLCPILEFVANTIIIFLDILTLGALPFKSTNFCCGQTNCTPQPQKRQFDENDPLVENGTIYPTMNTWIKSIIKFVYQWNITDPCNISMATYSQMNYNDLTPVQTYDSLFCIMKIYWPMRNDNQSNLMISKCDALFQNYTESEINFVTDLRLSEQLDIMECIESRVFIDTIRFKTDLLWIPSDLMTNTWRKFYWGGEILRGLSVYFQYYSDRSTQPQSLLNPDYIQRWINLGLNTTYLQDLHTVQDVQYMLETTHLNDYFQWNNATQYDAVVFLTLKFWNMTGEVIDVLIQSITSNADTSTDNLTSVLFSNEGETSSILSGSIFGVLTEFLGALQTITNYWSNIDNLKRNLFAFQYYSQRSRERIQQTLKLFMKWFSENSEIDTEMKFRNWSVTNFFYTWSWNHLPKIFYYNTSNLPIIDYLYKMENHFKEDLNHKYIRTLLLKTTQEYNKKNDTFKNNTFQDYYINKASRNEFNIMMMKENGMLKEEEELGIKEIYEKKWNNTKEIFKTLFKGGKVSAKKWERIYRFTDHLKDIFHNVIISTQKRINRDDNNKSHYTKINFSQEQYFQRETLPATNIIHDEKEKIYIVTMVDPIEFKNNPDEYIETKVSRSLFGTRKRVQPGINITDYNITIPECASTIPNLCQECYYLDQLVGRFNSSLQHAINFVLSPSFQFNINMAASFLNYTSDPTRIAVTGGLQNCTQRFPSNSHGNLCYFGDRDPKIGFSDISSFFSNLTLPPTSQSICGKPANFIEQYIVCPIFWPVINFFEKFFFSLETTTTPTTIVTTLFDQIYSCNWDTWEELTGVNKRFSIGETGILFVLTVLFATVSLTIIFPSLGSAIFALVSTSTLAFVVLGGYLVVTYGWSYGCGFALPFDLGNDLFNFTAYILAPKCEWFLSSLINEEYTTENCYSCSQAQSFTFANCVSDVGFTTFIDNVVFMFQYYWPESIAWLRTAPFPFTLLFSIPYFESTLNKWATVDWNDPIQYSKVQSCAWGYTLLPNYAIFNFLLLTASGTLSPAAIGILVNLLIQIFLLFVLLFQLIQNIFVSIFYLETRKPYIQAGLIDENGADRRPPNTTQQRIPLNEYFPTTALNDDYYSDSDSDSDEKKFRKRKSRLQSLIKSIYKFMKHIKFIFLFYGREFYNLIWDRKNTKKNK